MHSQQPTNEWLIKLNEFLADKGVPPNERVTQALNEWFRDKPRDPFGYIGTPAFQTITTWFSINTKFGEVMAEPFRFSVYFFDQSFWGLAVPVVYGCPHPPEASAFIEKCPASILERLRESPDDISDLNRHLEREINLLVCLHNIEITLRCQDSVACGQRGLAAADLHLEAGAALLRLPNPHPRAIESLRFSVEIALKAFITNHHKFSDDEWDDIKCRKKYAGSNGHSLDSLYDAVSECGEIIDFMKSDLSIFPKVESRYLTNIQEQGVMWAAYKVAQRAVLMAAGKIESSL